MHIETHTRTKHNYAIYEKKLLTYHYKQRKNENVNIFLQTNGHCGANTFEITVPKRTYIKGELVTETRNISSEYGSLTLTFRVLVRVIFV